MPPGRSYKFAVWRACERMGLKPPGITVDNWEDLDVVSQSNLLGYDQIRGYEDVEMQVSRF
jgi:hypothetical protein